MRKTSTSGVNLIKSFESCRLSAYLDTGGVPTIGWGRTAGVRMGQRITQEQADQFLAEDLEKAERGIEKHVKVPLTDNQHAALSCLIYNVGVGAFSRSRMLAKLNARDYEGASLEFNGWDKDNGVTLRGLTKRRAMERALFLKGD
jgi:lysozyme